MKFKIKDRSVVGIAKKIACATFIAGIVLAVILLVWSAWAIVLPRYLN